ncbi:DUF6528 family protein [Micromonospora narathiwatensis]|uniref:Uncharacterized protein n=1 Tax=Micromonospora narathiwatensis TaxID=299146 RepID=A0A1A9AB71_9ACTN|nr:DUF6528 family protein [Micromonospora narathiwatensis]SBT53354.1 hypothetical protein GA0070621_4764 [Micromonospora narathiwatensis]
MRKAILAALTSVAIGAAAIVATSTPANAANDYYLAMTEQSSNRVMVWNRNVSWTDANLRWQFTPGTTTGAWANLSDVKFRDTAAHGMIALVAASGGKAAIVQVKSGSKKATTSNILWQATPGGNPHAIERIPSNGSVVVASSNGYLTLYSPSNANSPSTLAKVQTITVKGAHGVLYDPTHKFLWAIGEGRLTPFTISGSGRSTRLSAKNGYISLGTYKNSAGKTVPNLGHDLQPSYTSKDTLFITHTSGVYSVNTWSFRTLKESGTTRVKAYVNQRGGERAWIRGDNTGSRPWASPTVQFFNSSGKATTTKSRSGARFYKVRIWTTAFE